MLKKLLKLYQRCQTEKQSMTFDLIHDKISNWEICIIHRDTQTEIFLNNDDDLELLICKAYVALKEWADGNLQ